MDNLTQFLSLPASDQKRISRIYRQIARMGVPAQEIVSQIVESRVQCNRYRAEHREQVRAEQVRDSWQVKR